MENIHIKRNHDKRIKSGHLWIFSNELEAIPELPAGSIVEIYTSDNTFLGLGFYNPHSLISVRLLKTNKEINIDFFLDRISNALNLRKILNNTGMSRIVFGESDLLPGLIVDKYGEYLSIQISSAGMENLKDVIIDALLRVIPNIKGIIAKNNSKPRELEGLTLDETVLFGEIPDEIITNENGIILSISLKQSQKTGYFIDQSNNRKFIISISKNINVLDCYCNQGGFGLHAAKAGAKEIICVDSSDTALSKARRNAELNNFSNIRFVQSDVADYLKNELTENRKWDLIILDPPAFAKSKKDVKTAIKGYAKINRLAMQLLSESGFLATSSCSQHISEEVFLSTIQFEAAKLNIQLRQIFRGTQSPDHPILASMPETKYLKFFVFQKISI
ncbi:MAG: class I SAM-dependent rRNA methyltransferase [Ignavibacteriae bacterium]|nr:class I SAM-dependent rRNA methyltransferase [Ignavibacteriota bacterium]